VLLVILILLAAGMGFVAAGRRIEGEARAATGWPVVVGQLEECEVVERRAMNLEDPSTWDLRIRYSYVVRGITHHSTRYAYGYGGGIDDEKYRRVADELQRNPQLSIRYNPRHPSEAVICTTPQTGLTRIGRGCLITATVAMALWLITKYCF
jgi:hypothetical protein